MPLTPTPNRGAMEVFRLPLDKFELVGFREGDRFKLTISGQLIDLLGINASLIDAMGFDPGEALKQLASDQRASGRPT